jgi:(p)ppGpp synthase/HD superfamily hydrolase
MIYTALTKQALKLCFEAHRDQTDKSGMPYVFHPFHLAEQMDTEESTTVALLHDIVEDTDYTLEDLKAMGFPNNVIDALALMTHDPRVPYMEYVKAISENPLATKVKLADLRHNSDLSRLDSVDEKALSRVKKYAAAIELLESVACQATI